MNAKLESILDSTKQFVKENKHFCIGASLYVLTAAVDAYMTSDVLNSLKSGVGEGEMNPVPEFFMKLYDNNELGLIVHKTLVGFSLAIACQYIRLRKSLADGFWINSPLYLVSAAQTLAAASWYLISQHLYF